VAFGWGRDGDGHDKGARGLWLKGKPNASNLGKLSKGGFPKEPNVLYKLTDPANGSGIDAIWRADPETNSGKKFAIVEAKASKDEDGPKFMRKPGSRRKPVITSKLGVNGIGDVSELLEPIEPPAASVLQHSGKRSAVPQTTTVSAGKEKIIVQMSTQWIRKNIPPAVKGLQLQEMVMRSYSRHLFFSPIYHLSLSPKEHGEALLTQSDESTHRIHKAFHYNELEVSTAVNKKKRLLQRRHGKTKNLELESLL
jgi:hypothetical protein